MKKILSIAAGIGLAVFLVGCASTPGQGSQNAKTGGVAGALLGGAAGAVVGHQSGHALEGAAIGGAAGAIGGAVLGSAKDEKEAQANKPDPMAPTVTVPPAVNP